VGVFPEATISTSYELKEFKTGAARMAMEAGVPLLPCVIWGSQRIFTKGRKKDLTRGTPITIAVGEPFTPDPAADPLAVTAELKARMSVLLDQARGHLRRWTADARRHLVDPGSHGRHRADARAGGGEGGRGAGLAPGPPRPAAACLRVGRN
jgi:1-acyl-sn-glycerol-3-phosphate acyltransferase